MMALTTPLVNLIKEHPEMQRELGAAAVLKARNGDYDEADKLFSALAAVDTGNRTITLNRAVLLDQKADSLRQRGKTEDADGCDEKALRLYKQAMDADPPLPDAFFNTGFFHLKKYNYSRAKDCFETYIALAATSSSENADPLKTGDFEEDEAASLASAALDYKLNRAAEMIAHINEQNLGAEEFRQAFECINKGNENEGITHIRAFLELHPAVWNAWFLLGWGLRRLGRWAEAKEAFSLALKHGIENNDEVNTDDGRAAALVDTYNEMAICCLELKEYAEAEKLLYRAVNIEGENTKIMSNMGFVCLKQGKTDEALSWFSTITEFDPDDELAAKMVDQLAN